MKNVIKTLLVSAAICGLFATTSAQAGSGGLTVVHNTTQTQLSRRDVAKIQSELSRLNFYKGVSDGSWGPRTTLGVTNFQASRGLTANGMPTAETLAALNVIPTRRDSTRTSATPAEIAPVGGGAVYQENVVQSDTYTTRGHNGTMSVVSMNQNGSTCLTCTNGIYGTGNTANMHSNEY
jgi:peptidoglycan hydrolase-like protein with peptidoglycan-binding domain